MAITDQEEMFEPIEVGTAGSIVDLIRARREEHAAERELTLPVPGYGGLLGLRLVPLEPEAWNKFQARVTRGKIDRDPEINTDLLIQATREVVGRKTARGTWTSLVPGESIALDHQLTELLRFEGITTARQLVHRLFDLVPQPGMAITEMANTYLTWANGSDAETDEELLGE